MADFDPTKLDQFDASGGINASILGTNQGVAQAKRNTLAQAGGIAAGGDLEGGQNALLRGGYVDEAQGLQNLGASRWAQQNKVDNAEAAEENANNLKAIGQTLNAKGYDAAAQQAASLGLFDNWNTFSNHATEVKKNYAGQIARALDAAGDDPEKQKAVMDRLAEGGVSDTGKYRGPNGYLLPGAKEAIFGMAGYTPASARQSTQASIVGPRQIQADYAARGINVPFEIASEIYKDPGREAYVRDDGVVDLRARSGSRADSRAALMQFRANAQNPDIQREISEYRTLGKEDGGLAQRKSIAGGALNHLGTMEQIGDSGLENALGVIQGSGGYQKFLDAVNSGRIDTSSAYHNARQTLAVLQREVGNAYHIAGTGADTDARMKETKEELGSLLNSPNLAVFKERLGNVRAILQGVINSPRPSAFGSRSENTAGSAAAEAEVRRVSGQPEIGGKVARPIEGSPRPGRYEWQPDGSLWAIQ